MSDVTKLKDQGYRRVCRVDDIPEHIPRKVEFEGRGVLVCRDDGDIFAVDEICPHKNQSMERAPIVDGTIVCPHHQYRFDLQTGSCNRRCAPVQTYRVQITDGAVWLQS